MVMRKWLTAFVWIVVVALGTGASEFYKTLRHPKKMDEFVAEYEQAWANALKDVSKSAPPSADDIIKITKAPLAYHTALRKKFAEISDGNQKEYDRKAAQMLDDLEVKFNIKWEDAIEDGADSPPIEVIVNSVNEYHQEKLKKRLESANETMNNKHPRIKLALDSFSGYSVFRSREFLAKLSAQNIKLHLVDDDAVYKKRIETLQNGVTPLAVFTIDAFINNSAGAKTKDDEPPGKIVLVIDESVGADAMIGYEKTLGDLNALKQPGVKIVFTRDSP